MKKIILLLVALATITLTSFGQTPEGFKYQAVIRDAGNGILNNQAVGMQLSIIQGSIEGTVVYTETFEPTTNAYGLVNLEIGTGTSTDSFSDIDWSDGPYFIETAFDAEGGISYTVMGTSQLMSVPYALHAKTAEIAEMVVNDAVDDADNDPTNEIETWETLEGIPADIADGDAVDDADNDPTNEIETWESLEGIPSDIADGDDVNDADNIVGNEYVTSVALNGSSLEITDGGGTYTTDLSSLQSDAGLWEESGSNIYYTDGHVGIGLDPSAPLSLLGAAGFGSVGTGEAYSMLVTSNGHLSFYADNMEGTGTATLTLDDSSEKRVGIGTDVPEEKLHVASGGVRVDEQTTEPSANTMYGNSLPIAYGYLRDEGTLVIGQDYGIAAAEKASTGSYQVTLDQSFSSSPVVMITSFNNSFQVENATYSFTAPNIINVKIVNGEGSGTDSNFSMVVFGTPLVE